MQRELLPWETSSRLTSTTGCSKTCRKRGLGGARHGPVLSRLGVTLWGLSAFLSGVLCLMDQPASPVRCPSPVWRSTLQNAACHPDLLAQSEATSADLTAQSPKAFGKKGSGLHVSSTGEAGSAPYSAFGVPDVQTCCVYRGPWRAGGSGGGEKRGWIQGRT